MNYLFKIFLATILLFNISYAASIRGLDGFVKTPIDVSKNARAHNNMGNIFFDEKNYVAALKEYQIAYNLVPNTPQSAVYLYNISRCFIVAQKYALAKNAILGAIKNDYSNLTYYNTLADCIVKLKQEESEIKKYLADDKNPYNKILVGLIYLKLNQKTNAKIIFDEFIANNPDMLVVDDIKKLLKNL